MQLAMPDKPDVEASRQLYDRLCAYAVTLDRSTPASIKSRFVKLMPAFKSFAESIEILTPLKIEYDRQMAVHLSKGHYKVQQAGNVWRSDLPGANKNMADKLSHIDSLRSKICDYARVIMTIIDS